MTLKNLLFALILIITFFSCSNSDDDSELPEDTNLLLKERITSYDGDILTEIFSYNGNKLTSILDSEGYEYEYIYDGDLLIRLNYKSSNGIIIDYSLFEYDTDNRLDSYIVYTDANEGLRFDLTYNADGTNTETEYIGDYDTQDSFIGENIITRNNRQTITEIDDDFEANREYDTKNGIYKSIFNIETLNLINIDFSGYIDSGENNLLRVTENDNGSVDVIEEYQYTYNSSNYPETATYFYDGELDSTIQYMYE